MRPLKRDVARLRAISEQLKKVDHRRSVLEEVIPAIAELIGTNKATAYTLRPSGSQVEVDELAGTGLDLAATRARFQKLVSDRPMDWATYNATKPAPHDRNVVVDVVARVGWDAVRAVPNYERVLVPAGLGNHHQLRLLVCEGEAMLAFLCGWRHGGPFTSYEGQLLHALVPELRRALTLERQMRDCPALAAGLEAALDAIPGEAYVLDARRQVRHANAAGRARLDRARTDTLARLDSTLGHSVPGVQLSRLATGGSLVVFKAGPDARVESARARFHLTPRQTDVLRELARGRSNLEICAALGLAAPTVESHLKALFAKMECESRSELLARLLE